MDIIKVLQEELQIGYKQAEAAVGLIDEGNTIPFIARYRKEATGSLNDEVLRNLDERLKYLRNLEEKKEQVISSIREQEKLTPELEKQILEAMTMVAVEDLYRPYRPADKGACRRAGTGIRFRGKAGCLRGGGCCRSQRYSRRANFRSGRLPQLYPEDYHGSGNDCLVCKGWGDPVSI